MRDCTIISSQLQQGWARRTSPRSDQTSTKALQRLVQTGKLCIIQNKQKNHQKYLEQSCPFHNGDEDTFSNSCSTVKYKETHEKLKRVEVWKSCKDNICISVSFKAFSSPKEKATRTVYKAWFLKAPAIFSNYILFIHLSSQWLIQFPNMCKLILQKYWKWPINHKNLPVLLVCSLRTPKLACKDALEFHLHVIPSKVHTVVFGVLLN